MARIDFDVSVLRSLVAGIDLGSFAKASNRVGRSTSAISAQIRKLEEQAGSPLFRKSGRGLALTEAGETMLAYARRMIALNDEAAIAVRGVDLHGSIRLGIQEDFGEALLPNVLGRFARAHPKVRIEARVARNAELLERVTSKQLDLALVWGDSEYAAVQSHGASRELIAVPDMCWIGPATGECRLDPNEPLPLVTFDRACLFHHAATSALDRAGIPWRVAFTSPSLSGLWAATGAGLGLMVRTRYAFPANLRAIEDAVLPLPAIPLSLIRADDKPTPLVERLAAIVLESIQAIPEQAIREAA